MLCGHHEELWRCRQVPFHACHFSLWLAWLGLHCHQIRRNPRLVMAMGSVMAVSHAYLYLSDDLLKLAAGMLSQLPVRQAEAGEAQARL